MFSSLRLFGSRMSMPFTRAAVSNTPRFMSSIPVIPVFRPKTDANWEPVNPLRSKSIERIESEEWPVSAKEKLKISEGNIREVEVYKTKIPNFGWASVEDLSSKTE